MRPPSERAQTAPSRRPNAPLMRPERGFQTLVNPVTTRMQCSSSGSSARSRSSTGRNAVPLGGRNQRALLTLLLLRANEPVSSERLVDELWGEHPPRTATTSLQNTVSQLRKLLGPGLLHTRPAGTCSSSTASQLDLVRFERLAREARTLEPPERARLLREALALWRGPALADSELEDFAQAEIHRLEDLRLGVLEDRIAADLEVEVDAELVAELESLVAPPSAARAAARAADARALPLGPPGRRALRLPRRAPDARRRARHRAGTRAPGAVRVDPAPGALARARGAAGARGPLRRGAARVLGRPARAGARARRRRRRAATSWRTLLAERFELDAGGRGLAYVSQAIAARNGIGPLHDELHLALDRDVDPSPLHAWLAALPPLLRRRGLPQQLIVSTGFDTGVERAFEAAGEELDVVVVRRGRPRPGEVPPHLARRRRDRRRRAERLHRAWRWTSGASCSRSTATSTAAARASGRASPSARTITSTTSSATPPGRCRSSSRRACAAATCSSSGTPSTTGACASSSAASGEATGSRTAPGRSSRPRSTSPSELWRERGAEVYDVSLETYAGELARLTVGARGRRGRRMNLPAVAVQGTRLLRRLRARLALLLRPGARVGGRRGEPDGVAADRALRAERRRQELAAARRRGAAAARRSCRRSAARTKAPRS